MLNCLLWENISNKSIYIYINYAHIASYYQLNQWWFSDVQLKPEIHILVKWRQRWVYIFYSLHLFQALMNPNQQLPGIEQHRKFRKTRQVTKTVNFSFSDCGLTCQGKSKGAKNENSIKKNTWYTQASNKKMPDKTSVQILFRRFLPFEFATPRRKQDAFH